MTEQGLPEIDVRRKPSMAKLVLQLLGFVLGLVLLAWCARLAFSEENREQLQNLRDAPLHLVVSLLALSSIGVIANGLTFWFVLRPVRRIQLTGMIATNALATFLAYLPFKLSLMARIAIHRQRDGVPIPLIGPWFAAIGVVLLATVAPILLMAAWRREVDALWIVILAVLLVIAAGVLTIAARTVGGQRGLRMAQTLADKQPIGLVKRITRSETFILFDEGLEMLGSFWQSLGAIGLRVVDIAAMAGRFYIASRIVGTPMPAGDSLVGSVVYFIIGVFSPIGALGTREGGTAELLKRFGEIDFEQLALIALVVTAAEMIVNAVLAAAGIAWLRPDRLIRGAGRGDLSSPNADSAGQSESDSR